MTDVKNISVENLQIPAADSIYGGLAGCINPNSENETNSIKVTDCHVTGTITAKGSQIGGLTGLDNGNTVYTDCSAKITAYGTNTEYSVSYGGLIGEVGSDVSFVTCTAQVDLEAQRCGGLVGLVSADKSINVQDCNVTGTLKRGTVNANGAFIGGLNGTATITDSSCTLDVDTIGGKGMAGNIGNSGQITITNSEFEPARDNYTCGGWYKDSNFEQEAAIPGEGNDTYYAKWVSRITLDSNGGTCDINSVDVTQGEPYGNLLPTPTRTGYTFQGWYTEENGGDKVETTAVPTGNTTLYAQWTPNTYTIQFSGGDGASGSTASVTATYDQPVTLTPNGFTMAGKNFAGWATSQEKANAGTVEYGDQTDVKNLAASGIVTLYAVWTDKQVLDPDLTDTVVTYNGQPQKFHVDGTYTVKYSQNRVEVTAPTNAGVYDVEISRAEDDTYAAYHGRVVGGLVINKAPLTIKADDQSIRVGSTLPEYTYTVIGWQGNDTDDLLSGVTATCPTADANKAGDYTITVSGPAAIDNYTISYVDGTLTVSRRSSGGGSSSSGNSSSNTTTETTTNPDGSKTTTVTDKKTGTVTETTKFKDGSTLVVETEKDGTVTTTETAKNGVKVRTMDEPGEDVTATVTIPRSVGEAVVTIPADVDYGMVAVDADTGEIVKLSVPTEDGMTVKLDGSAELVLVERSLDFTDTNNHWAEDAIDFATAHELFAGTSDTTFSPDSSMTRAMLMTVLARFDGQDTTGGAVWYEKAMAWAKENGISDGSNPNGNITREQFATMLWRYAGSPAGDGMALNEFGDSASVNGYAVDAMRWAVSTGIISGMSDGTLAPQSSATRAQVATMLMRFVEGLTK